MLTCLIFSLKDWGNASKLLKMTKHYTFKITAPNYDPTSACSGNPRQANTNKIEKSSKIGQEKKGFISSCMCFCMLLPNIKFLKNDLQLGYVSTPS